MPNIQGYGVRNYCDTFNVVSETRGKDLLTPSQQEKKELQEEEEENCLVVLNNQDVFLIIIV